MCKNRAMGISFSLFPGWTSHPYVQPVYGPGYAYGQPFYGGPGYAYGQPSYSYGSPHSSRSYDRNYSPKNSPAIFPGLPSISDKGIGIDQGFDQGIVLDQGFDQGYNQGFDGSGGKKTKTIKKFKNSLKKTRKINRKSN
jgi:hypothetical protein